MKQRLVVLLLTLPLLGLAQKRLTENEVLSFALKNSASFNAASLTVTQSKQLQKTAFNLANPEITIESPTGEFMAIGVLQSFSFPSVYYKQSQLLKQQTVLAQKEGDVIANEVKYQAKLFYLSFQYYAEQHTYFQKQDSLYGIIEKAAQRSYEAGQIDYLQKTFTESQYGEVYNAFIQAKTNHNTLEKQLRLVTGLTDSILPTGLIKYESLLLSNSIFDTTLLATNPTIQYFRQQQLISKKTVALERHKFLPGFAFGYLNQSFENTPLSMRLRYGLSIPLWFWQYTGAIKSAQIGLAVAQQKTLAQQQQLSLNYQQITNDIAKYAHSIQYYEAKGNKQSDDLISAATRFYENGKYDLVTYLRTLNDAYSIRLKHMEAVKNYNQSIILLNYLKGTL